LNPTVLCCFVRFLPCLGEIVISLKPRHSNIHHLLNLIFLFMYTNHVWLLLSFRFAYITLLFALSQVYVNFRAISLFAVYLPPLSNLKLGMYFWFQFQIVDVIAAFSLRLFGKHTPLLQTLVQAPTSDSL